IQQNMGAFDLRSDCPAKRIGSLRQSNDQVAIKEDREYTRCIDNLVVMDRVQTNGLRHGKLCRIYSVYKLGKLDGASPWIDQQLNVRCIVLVPSQQVSLDGNDVRIYVQSARDASTGKWSQRCLGARIIA